MKTRMLPPLETRHAMRPGREHRGQARAQLEAFEAQLALHARWGLSRAHQNLFDRYRQRLQAAMAEHAYAGAEE